MFSQTVWHNTPLSLHHGGSSGKSGPLRCSEGATSTKTPGNFIQLTGRSFSFLMMFVQVSSTVWGLIAFVPYLLFVDDRSRVSLMLMVASHLLCISGAGGHCSSDSCLKMHSFLSFQMRYVALEIRILYRRLAPGMGFSHSSLKSVRPQPIMLSMHLMSGQ